MNPKYPIYIISKGRWESRYTVKALDKMKTPFRVVVEPKEYENYNSVINSNKILKLPSNFSELGKGSIPVRNWVWEHSIKEGYKKHWILDDNLQDFYRLNKNKRLHVASGTIFKCAEDFVDRYKNVSMAGLNYMTFAIPRKNLAPFYLNTRVYSCILLSNNLKHRWRGKYNEDTDLSLRVLKDGDCTILFNAFTCDKVATMRMTGGNTDELYIQNKFQDGRKKMAESLVKQHPDCVRMAWKWDRWTHFVDYKKFKVNNKLIKKDGLNIRKGINNYGMKLIQLNKPLNNS
tara:strand:- start:481 stop:1347 length:867 start_codon:yes stop_codon:yes gene_type:complete